MQEIKMSKAWVWAHIQQYHFSREKKEETWVITNISQILVRILSKLMTMKYQTCQIQKCLKLQKYTRELFKCFGEWSKSIFQQMNGRYI